MSWVKPRIALRGVRNSWLILARKTLLARLADSARTILGRCLRDESGVEQLALIAKLTDVEPVDIVGLRREIAKKLIDHEKYMI